MLCLIGERRRITIEELLIIISGKLKVRNYATGNYV